MDYIRSIQDIENGIQELWREERIDYVDVRAQGGGKRFVLGMFPYPSGNAHMGHILVYSIADVLARLGKFKGLDVLNPIGWDAFGLPAENAAIKNKISPAEWTEINIDKMRGPQIGRAGFSFDLTKEINTSSPDFYKWTQWLFLKLYEHGQVYRANSLVNWDPIDNTVLANEQVIDGRGWRSGALIEKRQMEQWCLRITSFAEDLWNGLDELKGWSDRAVGAQRNWIGRSEGCEIDFPVADESGRSIKVFTTRPDTVFGVTSVTLAPEHSLTLDLALPKSRASVEAYVASSVLKSEIDRQADAEISGVAIGRSAINPFTGELIPIYTSDYVLAGYGTGAIMNVPAHDQRDFEFARKNGLEIRTVIAPVTGEDISGGPYSDEGIMIQSGEFDGLSSAEARTKIAKTAETRGFGKWVVRYRLRDWSVSRQRFWGAPIPMLRRLDGSWEPVPASDLPVILPKTVDFEAAAGKSPLALDASFYNAVSPTDGTACVREVDTMDTFMCSAWYAWRFLDPSNDEQPFSPALADRWMPIDYYVGGLEHANQHLIYFRYLSHFLHSIGYTPTKEPVVNFLDNGMIQKDGFKMSKSRGNVVRPEDSIAQYGADALRMYVLSDTPYTRDREWDDSGLAAKQRFLASIWSTYVGAGTEKKMAVERQQPPVVDSWSADLVANLYSLALDAERQIEERQALHVFIARIHTFAAGIRPAILEAQSPDRIRILSFVMQNFLKVLGLVCPHLADRLWRQVFGASRSIFWERWIPVDEALIEASTKTVTIAMSVDGKRRCELSVAKDASDADLTAMVEIVPDAGRIFQDRGIVRVIVVRGSEGEPRLLNVVTKSKDK